MIDPWILVAAVLAALALWLLARIYGWHPPGWIYGAVGVAVAFLGGLRRRAPPPEPPRGPVEPPRGPDVEAVRTTAGDILAEKATEDRARIQTAAGGASPEGDLAGLADARRRRRP